MALCYLPRAPLLTSAELNLLPSVAKLEGRLSWGVAQRSLACRALLSCSAKNSGFHTIPLPFQTGTPANRKSRATKSNAELCDELREVVLAVALPEHHVSSTKELLGHRWWVLLEKKDLANIVRRRGYKEITKLLMNPMNGETSSMKALANGNYFGKVSTEERVDGQETQSNLYYTQNHCMKGQQAVVRMVSWKQLEKVKIQSLVMVVCSALQDIANGVEDGAVAAQLSPPLPRGQNSSRFSYCIYTNI